MGFRSLPTLEPNRQFIAASRAEEFDRAAACRQVDRHRRRAGPDRGHQLEPVGLDAQTASVTRIPVLGHLAPTFPLSSNQDPDSLAGSLT